MMKGDTNYMAMLSCNYVAQEHEDESKVKECAWYLQIRKNKSRLKILKIVILVTCWKAGVRKNGRLPVYLYGREFIK